MNKKMKITLKDGSVKEYENNMSVIDIAKDISEGLARVACAGEVDDEQKKYETKKSAFEGYMADIEKTM